MALRINGLDGSAVVVGGEVVLFGTVKYVNGHRRSEEVTLLRPTSFSLAWSNQCGDSVDDAGAAGLPSSLFVAGRDGEARRMKKVVAHAAHRYHRLPSGERTIPRMESRPHHGHASGWPSVEPGPVTLVSCGAVSPARRYSARTIGTRSPASRSQD